MDMGTDMDMDTGMATRRSVSVLFALVAALGVMTPAMAGEWRVNPSISVVETATNNLDLTERHRKSDWITDITPGISIAGRGERLTLDFDYQLHGLFYKNHSSRNNYQNSLNAKGTLEALENWFFIDASSLITQQNLSAFGGSTNTVVDTNNSRNTTETRTHRISPYFKGTLGHSVEYLLRYSLSKTRSDEKNAYDDKTSQWTGRIASAQGLSRFGWAVDANSQKDKFGQGRSTKSDLVRGTLTYYIDPQLRASLIVGRESNNYTSENKKSHTIKGVSAEWSPTERTSLAATHEDRFFGNSNSISFSHRTAGTAWKYQQTKDTSSSTNQASGAVGTYFSLLDSMFSSSIPDPMERAAFINAMLASSGISPNATLQGGFLTTGVTLKKSKELSFALVGVRNTLTFAATRVESSDVSKGTGSGWFLGTDFSNLNKVRQTGASVNWSHKLTEISTLAASASRLKSKGSGASNIHTDETMFTVNFLTQLGPKTHVGLGARRIKVDGAANYTENAVTGTFSYRF
jgi:uncharacterized protein (PEP-CTERM system associated)